MFTKNGKKNYNPLGAKMLWIEATHVVCIPCVAYLDPFFVEQPVIPGLTIFATTNGPTTWIAACPICQNDE
jgi:hypothetical protein